MQTDASNLSSPHASGATAGTLGMEFEPREPPLRWLRNLVAVISGIGLLALMFVMAGDVMGRYFFNHPIPGAYELVEYIMAIVVPFSVAYSAAQKCHVGVDILVERLPRKSRAIVDILTQLVTIILVGFLIWQGWVGFFEAQSSSIKSSVLQIPNAPFLLAVPIGFMAFIVFMVAHLSETIREVFKP